MITLHALGGLSTAEKIAIAVVVIVIALIIAVPVGICICVCVCSGACICGAVKGGGSTRSDAIVTSYNPAPDRLDPIHIAS